MFVTPVTVVIVIIVFLKAVWYDALTVDAVVVVVVMMVVVLDFPFDSHVSQGRRRVSFLSLVRPSWYFTS